MDQDVLCSTKEAAKILGVSLRTVQLWVEQGALYAWKTPGGHRRVTRTSIDDMLSEQKKSIGKSAKATSERKEFRILIVEDEKDLLKLYRMNIDEWNLPIRLELANDGYAGLIKLGEFKPDLLISDLNMPGIDGFRMLRTIQNDHTFHTTDIIVVTALGPSEIADRGGLPQVAKVFAKPIPFSELEKHVRARIEQLGISRPQLVTA